MFDVQRFKPVPLTGSVIVLKSGCYVQNDKIVFIKHKTVALVVEHTHALCTLLSDVGIITAVLACQGDTYDVIVNV